MTRLRIKTETETLHDEQVSDENLADRKQAFALQVEIYKMQGIECKLVEGEDVEPIELEE